MTLLDPVQGELRRSPGFEAARPTTTRWWPWMRDGVANHAAYETTSQGRRGAGHLRGSEAAAKGLIDERPKDVAHRAHTLEARLPSPGYRLSWSRPARPIDARGAGFTLHRHRRAVLHSSSSVFVYGSVAGFVGGRVDQLLMRFADFVVALPFLLVHDPAAHPVRRASQAKAASDPMVVAMVLLSWPGTARLVRGQILQIREEGYIGASRLLGAPRPTTWCCAT